jgi:hypothetical protein
MFFKLMREGEGPKIFHVGRRTLISVEAARQWIAKREAAAGHDAAGHGEAETLIS